MWKLTAFLLLIALGTKAQDSAKVRFYIKGSEEIFLRINDRIIMNQNTLSLPVGNNKIEIYSPKYQPFSDDLVIEKPDSMAYVRKLKLDHEFTAYLSAKETYKRAVFWNRTAPLSLAGIGLIIAPIMCFERGPRHEEFVKNKFLYDNCAVTKETYTNALNQYSTVNTVFFTGVALAIGGTAIHLLLRKKTRNMEKPKYRQQNPFTLDYFELSMKQGAVVPQVGMSWNF